MEFEWDENKNAINRVKHDIDFWDAIKVFDDENHITREDRSTEYTEQRYQVIGGTVFGVLSSYTRSGTTT